jgi:RNA polymerase sigma factor (TIGR02999 family)
MVTARTKNQDARHEALTPLAAGELAELLAAAQGAPADGAPQLIAVLYEELRRVARQQMRSERSDHTLQATALVHEAYFRLINQPHGTWQDRTHFIRVASQVMRHLLIDHARARRTAKREGGLQRVALDEPSLFTDEQSNELLALNEALERLAQFDPRQSRVVELRFFGGLTVEETAAALAISPKTVKRDWSVARAWLYREVVKSHDDDA